MNTELDYLNKCIKFMEDTAPSKWNASMILMLKVKFLPRLKSYLEGVEVFTKDLIPADSPQLETKPVETQQEIAERVMNQ